MARSAGAVALGAVLTVALCTACDQRTPPSSPPPPPPAPSPQPPPPPGGLPPGETVTGSERLAWNQELNRNTDPSQYRFVAAIDLVVVPLSSATCTRTGDTLSCITPLPPLSDGRHSIYLYAILAGEPEQHSVASAQFVVTKVSGVTVDAKMIEPGAQVSGVPADPSPVEVVARGLEPVSDLAVVRDGRVFVAERRGQIQIVDAQGPMSTPALVLPDVPAGGDHGLFSVAPHPNFDENGFVFLAYSIETSSGPVYQIARGRELGGRIGQLAVIRRIPIDGAPRWAVLRFGPDAKLYLAASVADVARQPAVVTNMLLRLNDDGSVPDDSIDRSAVVRRGNGVATGIAWTGSAELLIEEEMADRSRLSAGDRRDRDVLPRLVWSAGVRPAGVALDTSTNADGSAWLAVGMLDGGVQAVRLGPAKAAIVSGDRHGRAFGAVRAVVVAPDGTVFAATANRDLIDRGRASPDLPREDFLLRFPLPRTATR